MITLTETASGRGATRRRSKHQLIRMGRTPQNGLHDTVRPHP
jgi:hypothetical protein